MNTDKIKTKEENPEGLYRKYRIQKYAGRQVVGEDFFCQPIYKSIYEDVDAYSEYFILRLDDKGEPNHVEACRKAVLVYAEAIAPFIPQLSKDLIEKYS